MLKFLKATGIALFFIFVLLFLSFLQAQEQLTITTYYPSPYGSYQDLRVAGNLTLQAEPISIDGPQIEWRTTSARHWNIDQNGDRLRFFTEDANNASGSADKVTFLENGNVGIGTMNPASTLDVNGIISTEGARMIINGFDGVGYFWFRTSRGEPQSVFLGLVKDAAGYANSVFIAPHGVLGVYVDRNGMVGIGTATPSGYTLAVNGSAAKPGGGAWSNFSDKRLKEIKGDFKNGLSAVIKLKPVRYTYKKDNKPGLPLDKEFVGLVSQDVQEVIPEAIEKNSDGYLMLNSEPVLWAMLNAIRELKAENDSLKSRIKALETRLQ